MSTPADYSNLVHPKFSAWDYSEDAVHEGEILPLPPVLPPHFEDMTDQEPEFDPDVHLAITEPDNVTLLDFSVHKSCPTAPGNSQSQLAYTTPFRFLSPEGLRVVREIIERNEKYARSCRRQPAVLRGMAYTSKFIRQLNEHPKVLEFLSKLAGQRLNPHFMHMNYAHTNIGKVPKPGTVNTRPVDQWHVDSVPFVLVILCSDMSGAIGGELEGIKRKGREAGFKVIRDHQNNVPEEDLFTVHFEEPGYAMFMQGSEIAHHVKPVQYAKEARWTCVNSYMPANVFAKDSTVYDTFIFNYDPVEPEAALEFARARAFRAQQQLHHFVSSTGYTEDANKLADYLENVAKELQMTVDLMKFRVRDGIGFYDEVAKEDVKSWTERGNLDNNEVKEEKDEQ